MKKNRIMFGTFKINSYIVGDYNNNTAIWQV
jgi:hypothetical protein